MSEADPPGGPVCSWLTSPYPFPGRVCGGAAFAAADSASDGTAVTAGVWLVGEGFTGGDGATGLARECGVGLGPGAETVAAGGFAAWAGDATGLATDGAGTARRVRARGRRGGDVRAEGGCLVGGDSIAAGVNCTTPATTGRGANGAPYTSGPRSSADVERPHTAAVDASAASERMDALTRRSSAHIARS